MLVPLEQAENNTYFVVYIVINLISHCVISLISHPQLGNRGLGCDTAKNQLVML